ncbi:MAG: ubiquitin-like small modifier protein 1 [Haloferacaceae archaeon]
MRWKLFADLAEVAGDSEIEVEVERPEGGEPTVDDALAALLDERPALADRVLEDGELREHVNLLRNGRSVAEEAGLATPVEPGDELAMFPPVSGG